MSQANTIKALPDGLSGMRVRLQRTTDARFFAGWVVETTPQRAIIKSATGESANLGDRFMVELYALSYNLLFEALVESVEKQEISLRHVGLIRHIAPREPVRLTMNDAMCRIHGGPALGNLLAQVLDVSQASVAMSIESMVAAGTELTVTIQSWVGEVDGEGKVIYCKRHSDGASGYRLAMTFEPHTRQGATMWARLFECAA